MNRDHFNGFLRNPETMDQKTVNEFKELALRYPYCSTIQILYAIGLFNENDLDFNLQLKRTAACVVSRKNLKVLFSEPENFQKTIETSPPEPVIQIEIPDQIIEEPPVPEPLQSIEEILQVDQDGKRSKRELLEIVHSRLAEIRGSNVESDRSDSDIIPEERTVVFEEPESADQTENHDEELSYPGMEKQQLTKEEILARFIRDEPRISSPKSTFFRPSEIAAKSNIDEEDIVSETLAQLFYEQGNLAKAVKIYEKLSLLFPEKSRYFADQILKINTK